VRAHAGGVPGGDVGVVHGEAVAVLADGDDIARAGLGEEVDPGVGVEFFGFEHGDEVFVAKFCLRAVGGDVVLEGGVAGDVHVARVPLISECRNGVDAPVEEDAELGVAEPVGGSVLGEGVPVGVEGDVRVGRCGFGADFGDLMGGVGEGVLRRQGLRGECRRGEKEEGGGRKRFHRDTIADGGVVL